MVDGGVAPACAPLFRKKVIRASGSGVVGVVVVSANVPVVAAVVLTVVVLDMLGLGLELIQKCSYG